jgi:hypothetical protein
MSGARVGRGATASIVILRSLNRLLRMASVMLVPRPTSAKSLIEHANVSATHHPSRGGRTVAWMYLVADLTGDRRGTERYYGGGTWRFWYRVLDTWRERGIEHW